MRREPKAPDTRQPDGRQRRLERWAGGVLAILGLTFITGPRVTIDTTIRPPTLPPNLDVYLAARGLMPWQHTAGTDPMADSKVDEIVKFC